MAEGSQEYGTILAADVRCKGDLSFESAAKIAGQFEGTITAKGRLFIAGGAQCSANVKAREVCVEGVIEGAIEASDRVELKPKGVINGDIVAAKMVMADGAAINGHCRIGVQTGGKQGRATVSSEVKPSLHAQEQPDADASSRTVVGAMRR